jgi:hypothetical protein
MNQGTNLDNWFSRRVEVCGFGNELVAGIEELQESGSTQESKCSQEVAATTFSFCVFTQVQVQFQESSLGYRLLSSPWSSDLVEFSIALYFSRRVQHCGLCV